MKNITNLVLTLIVLINLTACGDNKKAIMMERVEDPMQAMASILGAGNAAMAKNMLGDTFKAVTYKHCIQYVNGSQEAFNEMAEDITKEAAKNDKYNDIKKVTFIDKCPQPANGVCDKVNNIDYFYVNSTKLLNEQKEICEYSNKKWTSSDAVNPNTNDKTDSK